MEFEAFGNLWLRVKKGVILTPIIDPVIVGLEKWFAAVQHPAFVTSAKRDEYGQLRTIIDLALEHQLGVEFDFLGSLTLDAQRTFEGQLVPSWAIIWSRLLNLGVIINPPRTQKTLMDYNKVDESSGHLSLYKPPGYEIGPSAHFRGTAFDIGGGEGGISNELSVIQAALNSKQVTGLKGCTIERKNNCVHCDCEAI